MADAELPNLTVQEAIKLKHHINQQITYGPGLDARQVRDMERLTPDQHSEMRRQIAAIPRSWWLVPNYVWAGGVIVSLACFLYFRQWISQAAAVLAMVYSVGQLSYRSGLLAGYAEGYDAGHVTGIRKAYGITSEEAEDIHERAVEMEIDGRLISRLDATERQQGDLS